MKQVQSFLADVAAAESTESSFDNKDLRLLSQLLNSGHHEISTTSHVTSMLVDEAKLTAKETALVDKLAAETKETAVAAATATKASSAADHKSSAGSAAGGKKRKRVEPEEPKKKKAAASKKSKKSKKKQDSDEEDEAEKEQQSGSDSDGEPNAKKRKLDSKASMDLSSDSTSASSSSSSSAVTATRPRFAVIEKIHKIETVTDVDVMKSFLTTACPALSEPESFVVLDVIVEAMDVLREQFNASNKKFGAYARARLTRFLKLTVETYNVRKGT